MSLHSALTFPALVTKKPVVVDFSGGQLASDAGVLLLGKLDRQLGLTQAVTAALQDRRDPAKVQHPLLDLLRQRVYQIACGYEEADNADTLRQDPLFPCAVGRAGAGEPADLLPPGECRHPSRAAPGFRGLVCCFLQQHWDAAVVRIVLNLDATADPTHCQQELNFYNQHYRSHCYLSLLLYATLTVTTPDGQRQEWPEQWLLVAVLQPVKRDASFRAGSVLVRLTPLL